MKKAIITGANGLLGKAVSNYLCTQGVETLCLGRKDLEPEDITRNFGIGSRYLKLQMQDIASLPNKDDLINWTQGSECVFFNFAWSGYDGLTDGSFADQINNSIYSAEAVYSAKKIGCTKFVNIGTLEETFLENNLIKINIESNQFNQLNYALAKLASRDMCKMVAYLEKIDYVHTRLSIPIEPNLSSGTYFIKTLKKIISREKYESPKSKKLFDIIFIDDLVRAYYLVGLKGKNKADYYIGSNRPATLQYYFDWFSKMLNGNYNNDIDINNLFHNEAFNTQDIYQDTGFFSTTRFQDIIEKKCST